MYRINYWALLFALLSAMKIFSQQTPLSASEMNKKLGRGINMGNMFEAPSETAWGNPFQDDYFQRIAKLGFQHVRIPIRWDIPERSLQSPPYTINPVFLERIKFVVDKALTENLMVIINMHHHEAIFQQPDAIKPRFLSQWQQISDYFKAYDDRLLFEVLNEPNSELTPTKWNTFFAEALQEIRKTNPSRTVLIGTANWGGLSGLQHLQLPNDSHLLLTIHYYDPFQFTHQGADWAGTSANEWVGTKWENTTLERNEVVSQFQYLLDFSKKNNLPVHIGEFGAYNKADLESRVRWTNFLARWFEQQGFSWAYWEFSAGFGIYDPATNYYLTPLIDALVKNPMPEAVEVTLTKLVESTFTPADNVWQLYIQPQANATFSKANGIATINIMKASDEQWHVQFVHNGIPIKNKVRYLISFDAEASSEAAITSYVGKSSSPYTAYSGYKSFTLSTTKQHFEYSFTMQEPTDSQARLVFDIGSNQTILQLSNILVQEVVLQDTRNLLNTNDLQIPNVAISPNPSSSSIRLVGIESYTQLVITDVSGNTVFSKKIESEKEELVPLFHLPSGVYFVILFSKNAQVSKKIIKY